MTQIKYRELYPAVEPYQSDHLEVGDGHAVYYEECGNSQGRPVVFLHGGPGGGTNPNSRRFFDPEAYRIILFDQRGCGRSTPFASLEHNTTWDLVADIERLRAHLGIERWLVFGGSWGSTLALAYAQTHSPRVEGLILRGIFLIRQQEIGWFVQKGASEIFPEAHAKLAGLIPKDERHDLLTAYHKRLTKNDMSVQLEAALAWSEWEGAISFLHPNTDNITKRGEEDIAIAIARIECHYMVHGGFLARDNQLLENVKHIRHIPATIIQGRYDVVCPPTSALELSLAWPEAKLEVVPDAGHSALEPGITDALIRATDSFRN